MARTGNEVEELGNGVEKVEDLREEEEQECLAVMAEDAHHRERHSGEVAECVAHEHVRRIPALRDSNRSKRGA